MWDDEVGSTGADGRRRSDFERFAEERRRYAAARREARLIKSKADGGGAGVHPWIKASQEAKTKVPLEHNAAFQAARKASRLTFAGLAFLFCITILALGITRSKTVGDGAALDREEVQTLHVWHGVEGSGGLELARLAEAYANDRLKVVLVHQPDMDAAIRAAVVQRAVPHVLILAQNDAERLRHLGLLAPIATGAERVEPYLPLTEPAPWSLPLVAAVTSRPGDPEASRASSDFARYLWRRLLPGADGSGAGPEL